MLTIIGIIGALLLLGWIVELSTQNQIQYLWFVLLATPVSLLVAGIVNGMLPSTRLRKQKEALRKQMEAVDKARKDEEEQQKRALAELEATGLRLKNKIERLSNDYSSLVYSVRTATQQLHDRHFLPFWERIEFANTLGRGLEALATSLPSELKAYNEKAGAMPGSKKIEINESALPAAIDIRQHLSELDALAYRGKCDNEGGRVLLAKEAKEANLEALERIRSEAEERAEREREVAEERAELEREEAELRETQESERLWSEQYESKKRAEKEEEKTKERHAEQMRMLKEIRDKGKR